MRTTTSAACCSKCRSTPGERPGDIGGGAGCLHTHAHTHARTLPSLTDGTSVSVPTWHTNPGIAASLCLPVHHPDTHPHTGVCPSISTLGTSAITPTPGCTSTWQRERGRTWGSRCPLSPGGGSGATLTGHSRWEGACVLAWFNQPGVKVAAGGLRVCGRSHEVQQVSTDNKPGSVPVWSCNHDPRQPEICTRRSCAGAATRPPHHRCSGSRQGGPAGSSCR
jgi:hypothetical protein